MQLKKTHLYIALMFALFMCLNAHSNPVGGKEYIRAFVYTARGKDKLFNEKDYERCHRRL